MSKVLTLKVLIKAKTNFCGECRFKDDFRGRCLLLDTPITKSPRGHFIRHADCHKAEAHTE
jgi:hypothetical protein